MLAIDRFELRPSSPTALEIFGWWGLCFAACSMIAAALVFFGVLSFSVIAFAFAIAVPWLVAGGFLSRRILRRMHYHHMMTLEDLARVKFRSLFFWPMIYLRLALTLWIAKVL
jgi:hypothetical protein